MKKRLIDSIVSMSRYTPFLLVTIMLFICFGCNKESNHGSSADDRTINSREGTDEFKQVLVPGMTTNNIIAKLGKPQRILPLEGNKVSWLYSLQPFPAPDMSSNTYIGGVVIGVTNGFLENWGYSYFEGPPIHKEQLLNNGDVKASKTPILSLSILSNEQGTDGKHIDTLRFPNLGYIKPSLSLSITKLKEVEMRERIFSNTNGKNQKVWDFGIVLMPEDKSRFMSLTETNVLKTLVIIIDEEPISASMIMSPFVKGSFEISCYERTIMEEVKKKLERMQQ